MTLAVLFYVALVASAPDPGPMADDVSCTVLEAGWGVASPLAQPSRSAPRTATARVVVVPLPSPSDRDAVAPSSSWGAAVQSVVSEDRRASERLRYRRRGRRAREPDRG